MIDEAAPRRREALNTSAALAPWAGAVAGPAGFALGAATGGVGTTLVLSLIGAAAGVLPGAVARGQIRRDGGRGLTRATFGLVIGLSVATLVVLLAVVVVAVDLSGFLDLPDCDSGTRRGLHC